MWKIKEYLVNGIVAINFVDGFWFVIIEDN